jgi:protein-S-isoprenylcysteine O-methyltransferase Ste14
MLRLSFKTDINYTKFMSLVPVFELGLWNGWILNLPEFFFWSVGSKILQRSDVPIKTPRYEKNGKKLYRILTLTILVSYVYSLFLPLKPCTLWFYTGLLLYVAGILIEIIALRTFAFTPVDKPVTTGIYRVSRNPMYIGEFLKGCGIGLVCVSWMYTLLAITEIMLWHRIVLLEEFDCLEKYGEAYKEYMNRIPRWI